MSEAPLRTRLADAAARLAAAGIEEPRREARRLLAHAAGVEMGALLGAPDGLPTPGLDALVARRAAREPLALILGHQPFWTLDLLVSADTLIPRADSETLIEAALHAFPARDPARVLDLGCGTGCLLLAALAEFPGAWGVGVDRVPGAAALARRNARVCAPGRAAILCGDWAAALGGRFDLVLSNPPYIESADIGGLMPEVARHEPASALDGGADGLDAYRALAACLPGLLSARGVAILELGAGQEGAVSGLMRAAGLEPAPARPDISGIPRALPVRPAKKTVGDGGGGL